VEWDGEAEQSVMMVVVEENSVKMGSENIFELGRGLPTLNPVT